MKIEKIEIEVMKMTRDEERALWDEWQQHYTDNHKVYVAGHQMLGWYSDDGDNQLFLKDKDGKEFYISVSIEK